MKKNLFTKLISIVLVMVMLVTCMGAYGGGNDKKLYYASNLMGANLVANNNVTNRSDAESRFGQNLVLLPTENENEWIGEYSLSMYILVIKLTLLF